MCVHSRLAVHVVAEQSHVAEVRIDPLAVGGGRFGSQRVLDVVRLGRHGRVRRVLPQRLAGVQIEAEYLPLVLVRRLGILVGVDVFEIQPFARLASGPVVDARGQHDTVAPHDGRRPAQARHVRLPQNVLARPSSDRAASRAVWPPPMRTAKKPRHLVFGLSHARGCQYRQTNKCRHARHRCHSQDKWNPLLDSSRRPLVKSSAGICRKPVSTY